MEEAAHRSNGPIRPQASQTAGNTSIQGGFHTGIPPERAALGPRFIVETNQHVIPDIVNMGNAH
jgi:hypothetical protein